MVNQDVMKLNYIHHLDYADDINILGGTVNNIKKNAETLIVAR
jgi:hypothetical protein